MDDLQSPDIEETSAQESEENLQEQEFLNTNIAENLSEDTLNEIAEQCRRGCHVASLSQPRRFETVSCIDQTSCSSH